MKIGPVLTDFIQQAKVAAYLLQCLAFFWYPNVRKYSPSSLYQDALTIPARPSSQRIGTVLKLICNFKTFDKVRKVGSLERCGYLTVWSIHKKRTNICRVPNRHLPSRIGQQNRRHSTSVECCLFLCSYGAKISSSSSSVGSMISLSFSFGFTSSSLLRFDSFHSKL